MTHESRLLHDPVHERYSDEHVPLLAVASHELHDPPPEDWHEPALQKPPLHELPHDPQLFGSLCVSTHLAPHAVSDEVHAWSAIDSVDDVSRSSHA